MKIIIDGKPYELDSDWLVEQWYHATKPYVDPNAPEGKKYTDIRLGAKALLRLHVPAILRRFANVFRVADWRTLQPQRGEDMLVKLHQYMTILLRMETHALVLELETVGDGEDSSNAARIGGHDTATRVALARASFADGPALYERPDTRRALGDAARPDTVTGASTSGSRLVADADTSAVS